MTAPADTPRAPAARRGVTLVEIPLAAATIAIVIGSLFLTLRLTLASVPQDNDPSADAQRLLEAAEYLTADLMEARGIKALSAGITAVRVSDRDGSGADNRVLYTWAGATSGRPGPLSRTDVDGLTWTVLDPCTEFSIALSSATDRLPVATLTIAAESGAAITIPVALRNPQEAAP